VALRHANKKPRRFWAYEALFRRLRSTSENDIAAENPVAGRLTHCRPYGSGVQFANSASPLATLRGLWTAVPQKPSALSSLNSRPLSQSLRPGEGWIHEIKHDGYRTLIIIDKGDVRAFSRHGRDWTGPYRRVVGACTRLSCRAALIDCNSCFVIVIAGMERPLRKVGFLSRP
jgi:hypothetical protein